VNQELNRETGITILFAPFAVQSFRFLRNRTAKGANLFALDSYSLRSLSNQKFWKKALTLSFKISERFIRKSQDFASTAPRAD
jgi:hypothetical protein